MMPSKISVFDFDGTLFRSPLDTPDNRRKYELATGIPWIIDKNLSRQLSKKHGKFIGMRRGWWGRAETLEPPLVPNPAPKEWFNHSVCNELRQSMENQDILTLVLTGRHSGLAPQVLRICSDGKLFEVKANRCSDTNVQCYFLGDDGPLPKNEKPSDTFGWKIWLLAQFLEMYASIDVIEIWEDREEHVKRFLDLSNEWGIEILVNQVH